MNAAEAPILENSLVKELLGVLRGSGVKAPELAEVIRHVTAIERELARAAAELATLRSDIAALREECGHPVKFALEKAAARLSSRLQRVRDGLSDLKDKIIENCGRFADMKSAKIESMSEQYHAAGLAARNIGRAFSGREPLQAIKSNGRLAALIESPVRL
ncbi:MAG: hypothetical protein LBK41_07545 [Clostridiales bacterium]|jgi:ElaB/YqjD/DUF883 family membrane-anchored ribosome-binding protein|nr:hypothetical protein [Clostridiales bacterium]